MRSWSIRNLPDSFHLALESWKKYLESHLRNKAGLIPFIPLCGVLPQGRRRSGAQNQGHLWNWLSPFVTIAKSHPDRWLSADFLIPNEAEVPTLLGTLRHPNQSPNAKRPAGIRFVLRL